MWPSAEYISAVKALNVYPNVQALGYINTANGTRDNATIHKEIATYAGWSDISGSNSSALHGIYFDQTPYANFNGSQAYLKNITATVRESSGFGQTPFIVHNTGCVPDASLVAHPPDVVVIFQGGYADMPGRHEVHYAREKLKVGRENMAMLVNSVPQNLGRTGLRKIVDNARRDVEWLYVSDLTDNVYTSGNNSVLRNWLDVSW